MALPIPQTRLLIRLELLMQPPLCKLLSASFHIWHHNDFTEPPRTFSIRLCHQRALPAFFQIENDQNHVPVWPRTSEGQAQSDSAQENCCSPIKLLDKGAKAEFTFKRVRKIISPLLDKFELFSCLFLDLVSSNFFSFIFSFDLFIFFFV